MTKTVDQKILYPKSWYIDNSKSLDGNAKKTPVFRKNNSKKYFRKTNFFHKINIHGHFLGLCQNIHRGFKDWKENPETVKRAE